MRNKREIVPPPRTFPQLVLMEGPCMGLFCIGRKGRRERETERERRQFSVSGNCCFEENNAEDHYSSSIQSLCGAVPSNVALVSKQQTENSEFMVW